MEFKARSRGVDIAIFSLFPVTMLLFVLSVGLSQGRLGVIALFGFYIAYASFFALPVWITVRIVRDRNRSPKSLLWVESCLGGSWLATGIFLALVDPVGRLIGAAIASAAGLGVALTPVMVRDKPDGLHR